MLLDWKFCRPRRLLEYHLQEVKLTKCTRECIARCNALHCAQLVFTPGVWLMKVLITSSAWMSFQLHLSDYIVSS